MAIMADYTIGIEIEVHVEPHKVRQPLHEKHALYYEKLAAALRNRGLRAKANNLQNNAKYPDSYQAWWITRDSSLGTPEGLSKTILPYRLYLSQHLATSRFQVTDREFPVPMEAVSPVLTSGANWSHEIDTFWAAMRAVFHMPERSTACGSHIHVSKGQNKTFTLSQLKTIAYGIAVYEPLVIKLLMSCRTVNPYCKRNTQASTLLRQCGGSRHAIAQLIASVASAESLRNTMQDDRYVLWNFSNIVPGKSGTIEFRGGRFLRGEVRTKRWIAFTVAFIHALLSMVCPMTT